MAEIGLFGEVQSAVVIGQLPVGGAILQGVCDKPCIVDISCWRRWDMVHGNLDLVIAAGSRMSAAGKCDVSCDVRRAGGWRTGALQGNNAESHSEYQKKDQ